MSNEIIGIKLKKLNDRAIVPTQGDPDAVGWDLYANLEETVEINPGETVKIPTGIALEIPKNYGGFIFPRSGLSTKQGLRLSNCVGVIDPSYRGDVIVALYNDSNVKRHVFHGDRIAQLAVIKREEIIFIKTENLSETRRGDGGFGSTGC